MIREEKEVEAVGTDKLWIFDPVQEFREASLDVLPKSRLGRYEKLLHDLGLRSVAANLQGRPFEIVMEIPCSASDTECCPTSEGYEYTLDEHPTCGPDLASCAPVGGALRKKGRLTLYRRIDKNWYLYVQWLE